VSRGRPSACVVISATTCRIVKKNAKGRTGCNRLDFLLGRFLAAGVRLGAGAVRPFRSESAENAAKALTTAASTIRNATGETSASLRPSNQLSEFSAGLNRASRCAGRCSG